MSGAGAEDAPQLVEPLPAHRLDAAALARWLSAHVPEAAAGLEARQFQGGMSNPTYLLTLTGGRRLVLRKKPPGPLLPKAHAVEREHRVLAALAPTPAPTPRPVALCEDPDVIGAAFFVMEHVPGRIIPAPDMAPVARAERPSLAGALVDALATLHRVDWRAAGLEGFGRPEGYLARQTARWSEQAERSLPALPEGFDAAPLLHLRDWLAERAGDVAEEAALVHGDFRLGNMVVAPDAPRIAAVLDWELSTIGHPLADLAYLCLPWRVPPDVSGGADTAAAGLPSEDWMLQRYAEAAGRGAIDDWPVFLVFSLYRLAAIGVGVAARAALGNVSTAGADPAVRAARARRLAEIGVGIAASADSRPGGGRRPRSGAA